MKRSSSPAPRIVVAMVCRMLRILTLCGWVFPHHTLGTLTTCMAECSMPKRQGYCPVRDAPTQIFDGYDGIDSRFDLQHRSLIFVPCVASNYSQMGYQWHATEGEGYSIRGMVITQLPDDPFTSDHITLPYDADETATIVLSKIDATQSFEYYGRSIERLHVYSYGAIGFETRLPTAWNDARRFLRSGFWPGQSLCLLCIAGSRFNVTYISYGLLQKGTINERLVVSFFQPPPSPPRPMQLALFITSGAIQLSWLDLDAGNASTIVGLSHGLTPQWEGISYDALDLSAAVGCHHNANCSTEDELVRPIGPSKPPHTRDHPWTSAPFLHNGHATFCEFGCSNYYLNWTLTGCQEACNYYYRYDITAGYSDRAEVARYECHDGCAIGNLRCQPGFYCQHQVMSLCPAGKYRDVDYYHVTRCDDCPHGRYRETLGGRFIDSCNKCNMGRYNQKSGSDSKFDCLQCPPGRFANEPGMTQCKCMTSYNGTFEMNADGTVVYQDCKPESYLDFLRQNILSIDYSPRTTYP